MKLGNKLFLLIVIALSLLAFLSGYLLADEKVNLPTKEDATKLIKQYESEFKFKKSQVKATYEYKNDEVSFEYDLIAKDNGKRTLITLKSPKTVAGQCMLKDGFSYVWKQNDKDPIDMTDKQLFTAAWKSLLFYKELPLTFDFRDVGIGVIKFVNDEKSEFSIELTCKDKYVNGFEKAVLTYRTQDNVLLSMDHFWDATSDKARKFKFDYGKVGERRVLEKLEISYPAYNMSSTVTVSNIEFPEKIDKKELDLPGAAGYLTASEIVEKMDSMEKYKAMTSTGKQVIYKSSGDTRTLEYKSWAVNDGEKQLMKYLQPADINGDKILMLNDGDDIFVYFHLTGRIKNIATSMRNSSVMSSDFSYQDMAGGDYKEKFTFRILKKEELDKKMCYVMEAKPTSKGPSYEKILYWVDIENFRTYQADYYEKNKPNPIKRLFLTDYKIIKEHNVPMKITMKNLETGSKTEMETTEVDYPESLPDSLFSKKELKN